MEAPLPDDDSELAVEFARLASAPFVERTLTLGGAFASRPITGPPGATWRVLNGVEHSSPDGASVGGVVRIRLSGLMIDSCTAARDSSPRRARRPGDPPEWRRGGAGRDVLHRRARQDDR